MKTTKLCLLFVVMAVAIASCQKSDKFKIEEAQEVQGNGASAAQENFAIALSKAACQHKEVRDLLKREALLQFDNDYDVLYQKVRDVELGKLGTFRDVIVSYMSDESVMKNIERLIPGLTIYVTDITWLDPDGFCAENWDTEDERLAVTFQSANGRCVKLFANGYDLGEIEEGTIPGGPVLIVKDNERIKASVPTKAGEVNFEFKDDAFNGIETKGRYDGHYSTSWIAGQANNSDPSDKMALFSLNQLNPDILKAYEEFKDHPYAVQNDYIFYGLTKSNTKGPLRNDVRLRIVRFKISPDSFYELVDDPLKDPKYLDSFERANNDKKKEPTLDYIYSQLWPDGNLEIKVSVLTSDTNGNASTFCTYFYDVKIRDLFTVKNNSIKREQWGTTVFKWYYTWRYTLKKSSATLAQKWYYPQNGLDLPTWDLIENSSFSVLVLEEDTGVEVTKEVSYESKKANQINGSVSREIGANVDIDKIGLTTTYKNVLGWTDSYETTSAVKNRVSWKDEDDYMVLAKISYKDKYIEGPASYPFYYVKSYDTARFTFTVLPYKY